MKLAKEEYEKLPKEICLYEDPKKCWNGIPMPQIYSRVKESFMPRNSKTDILDNLSVLLTSLGFLLAIFFGFIIPWCLIITATMIAVGIACVKLFYKETALEYYRLYQESLTEEQQERRNIFIQWYTTQSQKVKEIKSKPLSEITMEDKEFVEKIEDQLRGLEWL